MGASSEYNEAALLSCLKSHPEFLEKYADDLGVRLPESKILSFQQGSMQALKAKTEKMAQQLHEMLENAEANRATAAKMLAFHRRLLAVTTTNRCIDAVQTSLSEDFNLPHSGLFVLSAPDSVRVRDTNDLRGRAAERKAAEKLKSAQCGTSIAPPLLALLPQQVRLESFLQLPIIHRGGVLAVVLVGHEDPSYFHCGLSTEMVNEMAGSLAVLLARMWKLPAV